MFRNLSVDFKEGSIYGLLGENGVGKTTLLKLICSLQQSRHSDGTIKVDSMAPESRRPSFLENIFYVPDEIPVPRGTVMNFVKENGRFYPNFRLDTFMEYAREFEIDPGRPFRKMSFGQQKKAHLAFALSLGTKYLLMDEPTNGLDIPSKATFRSLIVRLSTEPTNGLDIPSKATFRSLIVRLSTENRIIIISTHQVKDVENVIDPIIILDKERVLLNATIQQITDKLYFDYSGTVDDAALYREANAAGMIQVLPNAAGAESKVNIEALFNAVYRNKETIQSFFEK